MSKVSNRGCREWYHRWDGEWCLDCGNPQEPKAKPCGCPEEYPEEHQEGCGLA